MDLSIIVSALRPFYLRIVVALIILVVGLICGQLAGRLVRKILGEVQLDKLIRRVTGLRVKVESIVGSAVKYFLYFVFILWALDTVGLGSLVLNILAGGVVVIIIIAMLLGVKDFIPNAAAGVYLQYKGTVQKNDTVKCGNVQGKVIEMDLVETRIETSQGDIIYMPNSNLLKNSVVKLDRFEK